MTYSPPLLQRSGEITITPSSYQSLGTMLNTTATPGVAAAAWPAVGLVIFVPFWIPEPLTVSKLFFGKGAVAGNIDLGIYDEAAVLKVSAGTTAVAATANIAQTVDVTDTTLARGRYYMALVADTTTTLTIYGAAPAAGVAQSFGLLEQASVTLPLSTGASPATFAKYTRAYIPLIGVQGYRALGV